MTTKHTSGPWRVMPQSHIDGIKLADGIVSVGYSATERVTYTVCELVSEQDAARIVHCVNSHDALVGALTKALPWLEQALNDEPDDYDNHELRAVVSQARTALNKATGE